MLAEKNFGHTIQGDISTKRTVIDNLSSQMATLARYQAEKRSKNKETEEAITKLSENLARLIKLTTSLLIWQHWSVNKQRKDQRNGGSQC